MSVSQSVVVVLLFAGFRIGLSCESVLSHSGGLRIVCVLRGPADVLEWDRRPR